MLRQGVAFVAVSLLYAGVFVLSIKWVDEVFVNLEHPWNLRHHGRFSFSPAGMVDGTVELIYYGLLTPFAGTRADLIRANLGLGFVVGWLHLAIVWRLLRGLRPNRGCCWPGCLS